MFPIECNCINKLIDQLKFSSFQSTLNPFHNWPTINYDRNGETGRAIVLKMRSCWCVHMRLLHDQVGYTCAIDRASTYEYFTIHCERADVTRATSAIPRAFMGVLTKVPKCNNNNK